MSKSKWLFRCATEKERKSKNYSTSIGKQKILERFLNKHTEPTNPIDATFARPLPVQEGHMSRFVPIGYPSHASYFSDNKETTFYEYLYHIITHTHSLGTTLSLAIFNAEVSFKDGKKKNINKLKTVDKKKVLDPNTYKHSHQYVSRLKSIPSSITYQSVRVNGKANNHAIYNRSDISNISRDLDAISAKIINDVGKYYNVELDINGSVKVLQIEKKYAHHL